MESAGRAANVVIVLRIAQKGKSVTNIGSVEEEQETYMGGVWSIAHVEAEVVDAVWKVVKGCGRWRRTRKDINEERTINAVPVESTFRPVVAGEITVDSAAEESVCPKIWGKAYPLQEPARRLKFMNASGGSMNHYGEKEAKFTTGGRGPVMSLGFQVSDVQKPLAAVWRIADKGNLVQFGPNPEDNFIQNVTTKRKIPMIKKGGSYVIEADFVAEEPGFVRQVVTTM